MKSKLQFLSLLACSLLRAADPETTDGSRPSSAYSTGADFSKYAEKLREGAILNLEPQVAIARGANPFNVSGKYPWKTQIVTTVFAIGSGKPAKKASAWDLNWEQSFGGYDNPNPEARLQFRPVSFVPKQNSFYVALPYNDVTHGTTKPEARLVIPWFKEVFAQEGQSVCRDRWVAMRNKAGKICYAQWEDCGPFLTDHWQYVFGSEKPRPNSAGGAGLKVSPAVRDYLELSSTDVTDWKFVDVADIPAGPWAYYGENNTVAKRVRSTPRIVQSPTRPPSAQPTPAPSTTPPPSADPPPSIITRLPQ